MTYEAINSTRGNCFLEVDYLIIKWLILVLLITAK